VQYKRTGTTARIEKKDILHKNLFLTMKCWQKIGEKEKTHSLRFTGFANTPTTHLPKSQYSLSFRKK
jgi:hypothetical protein